MARTVSNTYHTIKVLSSDKPEPPITREDALSVGPLSRTLLDSLFTVIFLFHDIPTRAARYWKAGWHELWAETQRYTATYGADPRWNEWIGVQTRFLNTVAPRYLSANEIANPKSIPRWPHPGQILRDKTTSPSRLQLMTYLNDWYYKHLSSESHLSLPGLIMRSTALIPGHDEQERTWRLDKQRSDSFLTATVLALAFASEIEIECRFNLSERVKYVWTVLADYAGLAKELYDKWYVPRL